MNMKIVMAGAAAALIGCSSTITIGPLLGDPPEVGQLLGGTEAPTPPPETVAFVERFYRVVVSRSDADGDGSTRSDIWPMLSAETQAALDQLARPAETTGRALLDSRRFPRPGASPAAGSVARVPVSLVALFLVRRPTRFSAVQESATTGSVPDKATVAVEGRGTAARRVQLVRERGEWRLHQTDFSNILAAATIRIGDLGPLGTPPEPTDPGAGPEAEPALPDEAPPVEPAPATRPGGLDF